MGKSYPYNYTLHTTQELQRPITKIGTNLSAEWFILLTSAAEHQTGGDEKGAADECL